ncbi:hypothetical protein KUA24_114 [Vibrio phage HNL01]|nr:hypothetical protein KUA24_114 [Vibrio phage HNL01]
MSKVFILKCNYNQYDQLDGYIEAIFSKMPSYQDLKDYYKSGSNFDSPRSQGKSFETCLEMLSRGLEVCEYGSSGGDSWIIEEVSLVC